MPNNLVANLWGLKSICLIFFRFFYLFEQLGDRQDGILNPSNEYIVGGVKRCKQSWEKRKKVKIESGFLRALHSGFVAARLPSFVKILCKMEVTVDYSTFQDHIRTAR